VKISLDSKKNIKKGAATVMPKKDHSEMARYKYVPENLSDGQYSSEEEVPDPLLERAK
jgi:hypothetical protein